MSELPKHIREKLEQAAKADTDIIDLWHYRMGAQALWQLLSEQTPVFDECGVLDVIRTDGREQRTLVRDAARWQHAQLSAQVAQARAEAKHEWDRCLELSERIADLEKQLQELQLEYGQTVIKLGDINIQYLKERDRYRAALEAIISPNNLNMIDSRELYDACQAIARAALKKSK